eukprot:9177422-Pyramimonas_sp.AAC.1
MRIFASASVLRREHAGFAGVHRARAAGGAARFNARGFHVGLKIGRALALVFPSISRHRARPLVSARKCILPAAPSLRPPWGRWGDLGDRCGSASWPTASSAGTVPGSRTPPPPAP